MNHSTQGLLFSLSVITSIIAFIVGLVISHDWLIVLSSVIFIASFGHLVPQNIYRKDQTKVDNKIRYRINHSELEVKSYSSKLGKFDECNHPLEEVMEIDYKMSYKRHKLIASYNELPFVYEEEYLFPLHNVTKDAIKKYSVITFKAETRESKELLVSPKLFSERYELCYLYKGITETKVYIEGVHYISDYLNEDIEIQKKQIGVLIEEIKQVIKINQELKSVTGGKK